MAYKRWKPFIEYIKTVRIVRDRNTFCIIAELAQGGRNTIARFPFEASNKEEMGTALGLAERYAGKIVDAARFLEERIG